jgi:uncharacterized OB-fold protein
MMSDSVAGPEKTYFDALAEGRFILQHCVACERWVFYPRGLCPHCGATSLEWRAASGRGVVYATSVVRRRREDGGDHNVALIDLAEGPRLMSRVEGVAPEEVAIGMAVAAEVDLSGEVPVLVFGPAQEGGS